MLKWNEMEWNGMKGNETDKIQSGKLISNKEVFFGTFAELGSMSSFERGSSWATSSHAVRTETKEFPVPRSSVSEGRWFTVWFVSYLEGKSLICDLSSTYFVSCPFMSYILWDPWDWNCRSLRPGIVFVVQGAAKSAMEASAAIYWCWVCTKVSIFVDPCWYGFSYWDQSATPIKPASS